MKIYIRSRPSSRFVVVLAAFCLVFAMICSFDAAGAGSDHSTQTRLSVPPAGGTVPESVDKLMTVKVPLLALVIAALEEEGMAFNMLNDTLSEPIFHSARWDQDTGTLVWRFWVAPEGHLMDELRAVSRAASVTLLKDRLTDLAMLAGIEPTPGFDDVAGMLTAFRIPTFELLSEEDMTSARRQLAEVSVIQLAAPHEEGPILLVRMPDGDMVEQAMEMAGEPVARTPLP